MTMIAAPYKNHDHAPRMEHRSRMKKLLDIFMITMSGLAVVFVVYFAIGITARIERAAEPPPAAAWQPDPAFAPSEPQPPQFVHDRLCGRIS